MKPLHRILYMTVIAGIMGGVMLLSCSRPRTIKDDTLVEIFREIYLSNAYINGKGGFETDSIDIYKPIFKRHGHTVEDLRHTIDGFSKRKSSKFTDIIVAAKDRLSYEHGEFKEGVRILDYIDSIAAERYKREIFFLDSIRVRAVKDTAKLRINIPIEPGRYRIEYAYLLDTTDQNRSVRASHTLLDTRTGLRYATTNNWLTRGARRNYSVEMETVQNENMLLLQLGNFSTRDIKKPHLDIDSLRVTFYPTREAALDSLDKYILRNLILPGSRYLYVEDTQDSIPLSALIRRDDPERDGLSGR